MSSAEPPTGPQAALEPRSRLEPRPRPDVTVPFAETASSPNLGVHFARSGAAPGPAGARGISFSQPFKRSGLVFDDTDTDTDSDTDSDAVADADVEVVEGTDFFTKICFDEPALCSESEEEKTATIVAGIEGAETVAVVEEGMKEEKKTEGEAEKEMQGQNEVDRSPILEEGPYESEDAKDEKIQPRGVDVAVRVPTVVAKLFQEAVESDGDVDDESRAAIPTDSKMEEPLVADEPDIVSATTDTTTASESNPDIVLADVVSESPIEVPARVPKDVLVELSASVLPGSPSDVSLIANASHGSLADLPQEAFADADADVDELVDAVSGALKPVATYERRVGLFVSIFFVLIALFLILRSRTLATGKEGTVGEEAVRSIAEGGNGLLWEKALEIDTEEL